MRWTAVKAAMRSSGYVCEEFADGKEEIERLQERITGRFSCETIKDKDGNVIVKPTT